MPVETHRKERHDYRGLLLRDRIQAEMVAAYGGKCQVCGIDDPVILALDHVNNDGHVDKRGGYPLYRKLKREGWPQDRYQLLCHNCNYRKEHLRRRELALEKYIFAGMTLEEVRVRHWTTNTSGFRGVYWYPEAGGWRARISINGRSKWLGTFKDIRDAARAYRKAAIEKWGPNAPVPTEEEINSFQVADQLYQ